MNTCSLFPVDVLKETKTAAATIRFSTLQ